MRLRHRRRERGERTQSCQNGSRVERTEEEIQQNKANHLIRRSVLRLRLRPNRENEPTIIGVKGIAPVRGIASSEAPTGGSRKHPSEATVIGVEGIPRRSGGLYQQKRLGVDRELYPNEATIIGVEAVAWIGAVVSSGAETLAGGRENLQGVARTANRDSLVRCRFIGRGAGPRASSQIGP